MSATHVKVSVIPDCDICKHPAYGHKKVPALYDAATKQGPWAYLCQEHFDSMAYGLGMGRGQVLILDEPPPTLRRVK